MKFRAKKRKWKLVREKPLPRLWRWYRRRFLCEYVCDDCGKPYVERPKGMQVEQIVSGSSSAQVFVEERYGKKNFYVEFARTRAHADKIVLSPLFTREHLNDVATVAAMARRFIDEESGRGAPRRLHKRR